MRLRTIRPADFASETLAHVPIEARWLYAGLWTQADDEGRLRDHAAAIRSAVLPLDDVTVQQVATWLDQLVHAGALCRYEAGSDRLLHVPGWREQQPISHPSPSRLPACPTHGDPPRMKRAPGRPKRVRTLDDDMDDRARALLEELEREGR